MLPDLLTSLTAVAALAVVLALVGLAARLLRLGGWSGGARTGRVLAVDEAIALDSRRRLHLVRCGDRQVLVLTGGAQDLVVGWLSEAGGRPDAEHDA